MSEKFSPRKLSENIDTSASRALKRLQAPNNIPRITTNREELSARVLEKAAQIRERAKQLAENPRDEYEENLQSKIEARIRENEFNTKVFNAKERAAKITARAKQLAENPRDEYEKDIQKRVEAKIKENKNKARLNKAKEMAGRITARAKQVVESPKNAYEEDIKRRIEARKVLRSRSLSERGNLIHEKPADKVLFDLDEDVVTYENEGVPLRGGFESAKTQEVDMNKIFAEDRRRNSSAKKENRAYVNREVIEQKQQTAAAARNAIRTLGFEPKEISLILDEDFISRLKKRGYRGSESSVLASIAKEKANDLRSYFNVMGVSIDRYGEPDLGFLKKLGGLFGGYNKEVAKIKQSEDFQRMKLLDMLALDADEVLSAPKNNKSSFGKKAILAGAAAAAIGGAAMKGKGQPDAFSSRSVAAQKMQAPAEKVARMEHTAIPEYDFTDSEAGIDEDFEDVQEKEFPEYAKLSVPESRKVEKNSVRHDAARRDSARIIENAKYSEKGMSVEVKMNMLEDFFTSKEFKNLPKDIRQKMIYALAGSSIVSEPIAFKQSLDGLKKSISNLPDLNKKMSAEEKLELTKMLMKSVGRVIK